MIYELKFFYWDDEPQNDDEVIVAVYSSYELAERGLEKFAEQPRFKKKKMHLILLSVKLMEKIVRGRKDLLHLIRSFSVVGIG